MGLFDFCIFDLDSLLHGITVVPEGEGQIYANACKVCLDENTHQSGVAIEVDLLSENKKCQIVWREDLTERVRKAHRERTRYVEYGALCIAFLLIRNNTDFDIVEEARQGTTVDYYLASKEQDSKIFNEGACLEVSGIGCANNKSAVKARYKTKKNRLIPDYMPCYIIIVDFGSPYALVGVE